MTRTLLLACAGIVATAANVYAAPPAYTLSANNKIVSVPAIAGAATPAPSKSGLTAIYSNLATLDPLGVYMAGTGYGLGGPNSDIGQAWYAAAFTPTAAATVAEVDIAAGFIDGTKSALTVHIYADANGLPGQELWSHRANLQPAGNCCALVTVPVKETVQLAAGTQYWVGLTTTGGSGASTFASWFFSVADDVDPQLIAENQGSGWVASQSLPEIAFGIYSK